MGGRGNDSWHGHFGHPRHTILEAYGVSIQYGVATKEGREDEQRLLPLSEQLDPVHVDDVLKSVFL